MPIQIEPPHNNQNQNGFQRSSPLTSTPKLGAVKGQLISECLLGVIDFPKNQRKFDKFLPRI